MRRKAIRLESTVLLNCLLGYYYSTMPDDRADTETAPDSKSCRSFLSSRSENPQNGQNENRSRLTTCIKAPQLPSRSRLLMPKKKVVLSRTTASQNKKLLHQSVFLRNLPGVCLVQGCNFTSRSSYPDIRHVYFRSLGATHVLRSVASRIVNFIFLFQL